MRRGWRVFVLPGILLLPPVVGRVAGANWGFTAPGDPNRNWNVSASTGGAYDDNFFATRNNPQVGFRSSTDIKLRASVPLERLLLTGLYDYGLFYPHDVNLGGVDQSHTVNVSANYVPSPVLALGLSENFISAFQPGIVLGPNNTPVSLSNAGNYIYDAVGGSVNYALTPRWTAAVGASWDIWRYRTAAYGFYNDHEDYSVTVSALYALDARTTIGLNYQYAQDVYVNPGPLNGLNGYSQAAYLSAVRKFNPRLSLSLNGGYTIRNSEDGSVNNSPSGSGMLIYNFRKDDSISLTIAQSLNEATFGVTRSYSAQENTSFALHVDYRLATRLRGVADATYVYSSFTAPLFGTPVTLKPNEQAATGHVGLVYDFREWLSVALDYYRDQVSSSQPLVIAPYTRDRVYLGMTLTY